LIADFDFTASETQIIFGSMIAVFPVTMIVVGKWSHLLSIRYMGYISALFFTAGHLLAAYSQGQFLGLLIGIGVLVGIATGFGYWLALTTPVAWFPENKGLITGISGAGFGLGAVLMSGITQYMLDQGQNILEVFSFIALFYGGIIFFFSHFIYKKNQESTDQKSIELKTVFRSPTFQRLVLGLFLGTFAGLLIVGNLTLIGAKAGIEASVLVLSISLFAVANFSGRIAWGYLGDILGSNLSIFLALLVQGLAIFLLLLIQENTLFFLTTTVLVGFGFGGNFVLFAKKTAQAFGVNYLGMIYPFVYLGYALAGVSGPFMGGLLYDKTQSFWAAIILSGIMSIAGSSLGMRSVILAKKTKKQIS
jgi:OFA family oxalate/formate antiporter-like MFS transporter